VYLDLLLSHALHSNLSFCSCLGLNCLPKEPLVRPTLWTKQLHRGLTADWQALPEPLDRSWLVSMFSHPEQKGWHGNQPGGWTSFSPEGSSAHGGKYIWPPRKQRRLIKGSQIRPQTVRGEVKLCKVFYNQYYPRGLLLSQAHCVGKHIPLQRKLWFSRLLKGSQTQPHTSEQTLP
jgi:hypothetical protein